ncbi:MAG TPA: efflux transporter outer membrane subunit [Gemmatimonadales bacterium]|nr:efflux transporter outer membrane subunit [Gemmatimonadales bacterium]
MTRRAGRTAAARARWLAQVPPFGLLALATGCAAGPPFVKPAPPETGGYTTGTLSATPAAPSVPDGAAQRFVAGLNISGQWWGVFHSSALNDLVERALKNNPDLKAAQAALTAAREHVLAQRGAFLPSVAVGAWATRQTTSGALSPTPNSGTLNFSLFTPDVNVSFVPDVFGLNRRTVEALQAEAEGQRFALAASHIALSANVVAAAIEQASLREQIRATRTVIASDSATVEIVRTQVSAGYANRLDLAAQETQLAQALAMLPQLLKQLAQQNDLLARLAGAFPNDAVDTFDLAELALPEELPVSLPSQLVEQRPDVRQAEENLHAASAEIGVAVANRLPSITLTGDLGATALTLSQLTTAGNGFWTLGAVLTQPLFQGGALVHQQRAAEAAYTEAAEQYRSTVLTAFQNVADALHALDQDATALSAAAAAAAAARVTRELAERQVAVGYAGDLELLSAEAGYQSAMINLAQARANRYADTAALFQALGGGWWHRADIPQGPRQAGVDSAAAARPDST